MAATKQDIKNWLERGKSNGARYMIVVCDSFDYTDYPVYCDDKEEYFAQYKQHDGKNMQRIMETYDLEMSFEDQLNEHRANYGPRR